MDRHMLRMVQKMKRDMALAEDEIAQAEESLLFARWLRDTLFGEATLRAVEAIGNPPSRSETGT